MFMPTLEALPVWPRSRMDELPIWKVLEDNYKIFLEETEAAYASDTEYFFFLFLTLFYFFGFILSMFFEAYYHDHDERCSILSCSMAICFHSLIEEIKTETAT